MPIKKRKILLSKSTLQKVQPEFSFLPNLLSIYTVTTK